VSPTRAAFGVLLRNLSSRTRIAGLTALGLVAVALGVALRVSPSTDPGRTAYDFIVGGYCLAVLAPVTALVFASATLGDLAEDGTLVYLWLKPLARWRLAAAALGATLCMALPVAVLPATAAAAITGTGAAITAGTALATTLATLAYASLFLGLGLLVRRALAWGLAYVLIWENAVARAARGAARLSVQVHARSLLASVAGRVAPKFGVAPATAVMALAAVTIAAFAFVVRALRRVEVP
jgi:ABC-2 type transport system permease protein